MKKMMLFTCFWALSIIAKAQYFNDEIKALYQAAIQNNDTVKLYKIRKEISAIDMQNARFSYLPRIRFGATYTRLNDDIVFPDNLQQLLMGTQKLLIKEKIGMPFNAPLPATVPLQPVEPIQQKNIFKENISGEWLLFSGLKVKYALKAYQHQQNSYQFLSEKQETKLWLDISDAYDKLALMYESDAIINSSEQVLSQQTKFVNAAIANGLATPLERKKIELAQQKLEVKKLENKTHKKILLEKLHQLTSLPTDDLRRISAQITPAYFNTSALPEERPELKALNQGIEAKKVAEKVALTDYVPKLAAFGQYELRKKDLSLFDPKWAVGIKLQWNVFDGLNARNNARKEALERRSLEVQKNAAQEAIQLGYAKAKYDYELATDKVALKNKEVKLTEDTYDFVQKQYHNGLTTITELLNALNDVEKAKFEMKQSVYEQRRSALQAADISGTLLQNL